MSGRDVKNNEWRDPAEMVRYTIDDYWLAVYRQRWLVIIVVVVAAFLAYSYSKGIAPRYESRAVFYVPLDVAISGLGGQSGNARLPSGVKEHTKSYMTLLKENNARVAISKMLAEQDPPVLRTPDQLSRDVDLVVSDTGHIEVYARDKDPETSAKVANAYMQFFNDFHTELTRQEIERALERAQARIDELDAHKAGLEDERQKFLEEQGVASFAVTVGELEARRARLDEQIRGTEVDYRAADERVMILEKELSSEGLAYEQGRIFVQTAVSSDIQTQISLLESRIAERASDLKPDHPTMVGLRESLDAAKASLEAEITRVIESQSKLGGSLYADLRDRVITAVVDRAVLAARLDAQRQKVSEIERDIALIPSSLRQLARIEQDLARDATYLEQAIAARETHEDRRIRLSDVVVPVQTATPPASNRPIYPIPLLNVAVAAVGGLVAGILYAILVDHIFTYRRVSRLRRLQVADWAQGLDPAGAKGGVN